MNRLIQRVLASMLALMLMTGSALPTIAQESTPQADDSYAASESRAIALYPEETGAGTYISVELEPGESTEVDVVLGNAGTIEQTLRTYPVNALTKMNGGFAMDTYEAERTGATTWLGYDEQEVTLEPTEGILIPMTITVPEDATPGEYVTGLAAEQADAFEIPGSTNLNQRVRWSLPVEVIVPGERAPSFELGDVDARWSEDTFVATFNISNTGNVTVAPTGEARLINAEGEVIGVSQIELNSVYQGTDGIFITSWRNVEESSSYSIQVTLADSEESVDADREYVSVVPAADEMADTEQEELSFSEAEMTPAGDNSPTVLLFEGEVTNNGSQIQEARITIVTYKDGEEVDRYPIMQAVNLNTGITPVEARYTLPGGFTDGTYTFEVTIEVGTEGSQTILVTQPLEYTVSGGE